MELWNHNQNFKLSLHIESDSVFVRVCVGLSNFFNYISQLAMIPFFPFLLPFLFPWKTESKRIDV